MNSKYLTVVAQVKAAPGKEKQLKELLLSLVAPSRKDEGCVNYDLHQSADIPAMFYFHENWTSKELWERHMAKPDLQATLTKAGQMVAETPQITLWEKISAEPI